MKFFVKGFVVNCYFLINIFYAFLATIAGMILTPEILKYTTVYETPMCPVVGILTFCFLILSFLLYTCKVFVYELIYTINKAKDDTKND